MKPVIGLLLIFVGLTVGYLVLTGKLPSSTSTPAASAPAPSSVTSTPQGTGGGPSSNGAYYGAYKGGV
jgi:hypothetical protein